MKPNVGLERKAQEEVRRLGGEERYQKLYETRGTGVISIRSRIYPGATWVLCSTGKLYLHEPGNPPGPELLTCDFDGLGACRYWCMSPTMGFGRVPLADTVLAKLLWLMGDEKAVLEKQFPKCALQGPGSRLQRWDAILTGEAYVYPSPDIKHRQMLRGRSFQWATELDGRHVVIFWHPGYRHGDPNSPQKARGIARRIEDASGGWGQISVTLDREEHSRISEISDYHYLRGEKVDYMRPIMDGQKYGLSLNKGPLLPLRERSIGGGYYCVYYCIVTWGCRASVALEPA